MEKQAMKKKKKKVPPSVTGDMGSAMMQSSPDKSNKFAKAIMKGMK